MLQCVRANPWCVVMFTLVGVSVWVESCLCANSHVCVSVQEGDCEGFGVCENVQMHDYTKILSINGIVLERVSVKTPKCVNGRQCVQA